MKYVATDIETTCIKPQEYRNVIMLSMVYEDSEKTAHLPVEELPHFTCFIKRPGNEITGSYFALALNSWILDILAGRAETKYQILYPDEAVKGILRFLNGLYNPNEKIVMAGKNAGVFDYQFLPEAIQNRFRHRIIDPGSVKIDWSAKAPLGLDELKKRSGLGDAVAHDAYEDALDVIRVLRTSYPKIGA